LRLQKIYGDENENQVQHPPKLGYFECAIRSISRYRIGLRRRRRTGKRHGRDGSREVQCVGWHDRSCQLDRVADHRCDCRVRDARRRYRFW
jgi:hypothetical protein